MTTATSQICTLPVRARGRWNYYRRIVPAYLTRRKSQLTFWHETPEVNESFDPSVLGEYYMPFTAKANYQGEYDEAGIPLLNYHGKLGLQYNPIAIAQYGLGNYNLFRRTGDSDRRVRFLAAADWLVENLEQNWAGAWVWNHNFDWEYRTPLKAPWYSALAQGQGISLLVRAHKETKGESYLDSSRLAFHAFQRELTNGGVAYTDPQGNVWFEEYVLLSPSENAIRDHGEDFGSNHSERSIDQTPTHILNGFMWAAWGVYDFYLGTGDPSAQRLFLEAVRTLKRNLHLFDAGFWSLYEQSGTRMKMLASPFYHRLHVVQLQVMHRLTGEPVFAQFARRWQQYQQSTFKRNLALAYKSAFKLLYY